MEDDLFRSRVMNFKLSLLVSNEICKNKDLFRECSEMYQNNEIYLIHLRNEFLIVFFYLIK